MIFIIEHCMCRTFYSWSNKHFVVNKYIFVI